MVGAAPRRTAEEPMPTLLSRKRADSRKTWITDPNALLTALADAENAAQSAEEAARRVGVAVDLPELLQLPAEESRPNLLPPLREDERFGHASYAGVVVIIRRRRAA
jgi:hypothetical protein